MGFAIGIRYLTGYSVAAGRPDGEAEWPPHQARVFMALVSAHFENGVDRAERDALEWLESLDEQPTLFASDADERSTVTTFVPVNDKAVGKNPGMLQSASGWMRSKQARTFPCVRPHDDRVFLIWQTECPDQHRASLAALCRKVTRVGHSSSLVQMWVARPDEVPEPNWVPEDVGATVRLRKVTPGLLQYLEERYGEAERRTYETQIRKVEQLDVEKKALKGRASKQRKAELQVQIDQLKQGLPDEPPREPLRPVIGTWQGYRRPEPQVNGELSGTIWDPRLVVFRLEPESTTFPRLDLTSTLQVTRRMHEAVVKSAHALFCGCDKWHDERVPTRQERPDCWQRIPALVSGHEPDGSPTEQPHLAYFPLAFVGREHADGHLMGLAVALPRVPDRSARSDALSVLMAIEHLALGRLGLWRLQPEDRELPPSNLRSETWTAATNGATQWSTVTPIAFDKHPKTNGRVEYQQQIVEMIRKGCRRIAAKESDARPLAEPREVVITPVSAHLGVPAAHEFPRMKRKDGSERRHVHAILIFDEPVRGPIAICAGRYRGYGFCRPMRAERNIE